MRARARVYPEQLELDQGDDDGDELEELGRGEQPDPDGPNWAELEELEELEPAVELCDRDARLLHELALELELEPAVEQALARGHYGTALELEELEELAAVTAQPSAAGGPYPADGGAYPAADSLRSERERPRPVRKLRR